MSLTEHGCRTTAGPHARPVLPKNNELPKPPMGVLSRLFGRALPAIPSEPGDDDPNGGGVLARLFRLHIHGNPPASKADEAARAGTTGRLFSLIVAGLIFLAGCAGETPPPMETPGENDSKPGASKTATSSPGMEANPELAFLHQPFDRAVRFGPDAPEGTTRPPDVTMAGKSVGKLFSQVERGWMSVRFVDDQGRKLQYTATISTDLGDIVIDLMPELAPNHVRSFIALAEVGYYDGLCFESKEMTQAEMPARAIAGGSPRGDGDDMGGIGYWLPPEILLTEEARKRGVKHQPGMVGMRHGVNVQTAGSRFYICLTDAPSWDGEFTLFGKVTKGLEVAEKIFALPTQGEIGDPNAFEKPPRIERIKITVRALEK